MMASPSSETGHPPSSSMRSSFTDLFDVVVRRKWLILSCMVLGVMLGGLMVWLKEDVYRSWTVLLIEWPDGSSQSRSSGLGELSDQERVALVTQRVLSRMNLRQVIDEFHLYPTLLPLRGYEFTMQELRKSIHVQTKENAGRIEALTISFAHPDPDIARKVVAKLADGYIQDTSQRQAPPDEETAEALSKKLVAVKASLSHKDEELSAYRLKNADGLLETLRENLRTRGRLQAEQRRIQNALSVLPVQIEQAEQTIREQETRLADASLRARQRSGEERQVLAMRLVSLQNALITKSSELGEDHPDVLDLTGQIKEVEQALETHLKNEGEDVATITSRLTELRNNRYDLNQQLDRLQEQGDKISRQVQVLEARIEQTPLRQEELQDLEREYETLQTEYERLNKRWIEARISESLNSRKQEPEFRVLDSATFPNQPEGMRRAWMPLGGYAVGTVLGLGLAMILDWFSPTFRRSEDVEISLGLQTLATIPSFNLAYGKSLKLLSGAIAADAAKGELALSGPQRRGYPDAGISQKRGVYGGKPSDSPAFPARLNLVSRWRPESIVAEQYRVAATRLDLLGEGDQCTIVLVTSAKKGEGKTCTSSNLAYTLARDLEESTLVIDCDYKCPNLHNIFVMNGRPGVADFLAGQEPLEACLQPIADVPLWCMPAGNLEQHPVSLSKLHKIALILSAVKSRYRYIILDGPPILPLADINILSGLANIVLMVVRFGTTPKDVVQKAIEMIHFRGPTRLVLTDAGMHGVPNYVHQGYATPLAVGHHS
ncbi:MAG: GumC family protein [Nitrospirales bacterium]|nr:AAA family ATPase [Nitrospirales bacterium]